MAINAHKLICFVMAEAARVKQGEIFQPHTLKSAPHYFEAAVPRQVIIGQEKTAVNDKEVNFIIKGYQPDVLIAEAAIEVANLFSEDTLAFKDAIINAAYRILKKRGGKEESAEEYAVYVVSGYNGEPEQFLKFSPKIAALLKSEKMELDEKEIQYSLSAQLKYAKNDLAIVDWDGAFLFDPEGDIDATVELFRLANLQLLRYRILDAELDREIEKISKLVLQRPKRRVFFLRNRELAENLQQVIKTRASLVQAFQALDRDIKLIGDWYSARLYDLTTKKFKIDEWRRTVKDKLESLEDIYTVVAENFGVSRHQVAEWIQMVGFFILQIGWFILIILEYIYFTRLAE